MRDRFKVLREIESLEPKRDNERIAFLSAAFEFPWDMQRAYELALLRTFAVPRSAHLLVETHEFVTHTQKRYDDTTIIISTIGLHGYSSGKGRAAIRRMNQIHSRYAIPNDEFIYGLSTFVFEPIRWNARYGWRRFSKNEKLAAYYFWFEVGRRMNIKDIPESYQALERYNRAYELEHFAYSSYNRLLAEATRDLFLSWALPKSLWPLGVQLVYAAMDRPMRQAFGFPEPRLWANITLEAGLWLRKKLLRLLPPRREPYRLPPTRSYPEGYDLSQIGPRPKKV